MLANLAPVRRDILFQTCIIGLQEVQAIVRMNGQVLEQSRANICDHLLLTFLCLGVARLMVQIVVNVKAWVAKHSLLETLLNLLGIALQPIIHRIDITGICKCFPHAFFDRVRVICEDFDEFFNTTLSDCNFA